MDQPARVLLTTSQAVRATGLSRTTIKRAASAGLIPAYKLLNDWRFPSDLLSAWMEERFNQQTTEATGFVEPARATPKPDPQQHQQGAAVPANLPLLVLFPTAAHRGINDLPTETPAKRQAGRRRAQTQKAALNSH